MEPRVIIVDPEFRDLIPPLADRELADLEASLLRDGEQRLAVDEGAIAHPCPTFTPADEVVVLLQVRHVDAQRVPTERAPA